MERRPWIVRGILARRPTRRFSARSTRAAFVVCAALVGVFVGLLPVQEASAKDAQTRTSWSATFVRPTFPVTVATSSVTEVSLKLRNSGSETWPASGRNAVRVSYHWYNDDGTLALWEGRRQPLSTAVRPGTSTSMRLSVLAPKTTGQYQLRFDLVSAASRWFSESGAPLPELPVGVGRSVWDAVLSVGSVPSPLFADSQFDLAVTLENSGARPWRAVGPSAVQLSYHWLRSNNSVLTRTGNRTPLAADVAPGSSIRTDAVVTTPSAPGTYRLALDLISKPSGWFSLAGSHFPRLTLKVGQPASRYFSAVFGVPNVPTRLDADSVFTVAVPVTNTGRLQWTNSGLSAVYLAYHWLRPNGSPLVWDGRRTSMTRVVQAGTSSTQSLVVQAPDVQGRYVLQIDLVSRSIGWFAAFGRAGPSRQVRVDDGRARAAGFSRSPWWVVGGLLLVIATGALGARAWIAARRRSRVFAAVAASYRATYGGELWAKDR